MKPPFYSHSEMTMTLQLTSQPHGSAGRSSHDLLLDLVLVNELEDVRRVDEDRDSARDGDCEEYAQLESVNHHRYVSPVV